MPQPLFKSSLLQTNPRLLHGFFGTEIPFARSLTPDAVAHSRARLGAYFQIPPQQVRLMDQVHGTNVHQIVSEEEGIIPAVDGLVVALPNVAIGVLTADCVPLLFYEPQRHIAAVAHAGWRGALDGIVEATVCTLEKAGAKRQSIMACIGPCIHLSSYEVSEEFYATFCATHTGYQRFFQQGDRPAHYQFDLPGFVAHQLTAQGITQIDQIPANTYDHAALFSFRRWTHQNNPEAPRFNQVSMLMLT